MTSLEGIIRELFWRVGAWRGVLWGGFLCYGLLGFGYLRALARGAGAEVELPPIKISLGSFCRQMLGALPVGAFYTLAPLLIAAGVANLFYLLMLEGLSPIAWGLGTIAATSLTAVALNVVEDDPERFFLGLEFETVLAQWWRLKRYWALPSIAGYGIIAGLGLVFYGFSFFVVLATLVAYLSLTLRNLKYS